ncbi:hypothetical protein FQA39_LY13977 [Lamprigera yunnana]|nr:hypothetical protein FQA39_LY13977 [Lamprigera yunnana]
MVLPACQRPQNFRTLILALPKVARRRSKYVKAVWDGNFPTGVKPGAIRGPPVDTWRIGMLSRSRPIRTRTKYVYIPEEGVGSEVKPSAFLGVASPRTNDACKPLIRVLRENRQRTHLGQRLMQKIDNTIQQSWNTVYNYYNKQIEEKRKKREYKLRLLALKTKQVSSSEIKAKKDKKIAEFVTKRSGPKKIFLPPPIPRGDITNLDVIRYHMETLAIPKSLTLKYVRPSIDSTYIDPYRVKRSAIAYKVTQRTLVLARSPSYKLIEPLIIRPGYVKRAALKCKASPRSIELAKPRKKAAEKETDLKEHPFEISPFALKAKATRRLIELSKPIER